MVAPRHDSIGEICSIKTSYKKLRIAKSKLLDDIPTNVLCSSSSICVDRRARKYFFQSCQLPIFRSEVMSPVADAVSLIDGKRPYIDFSEQVAQICLDKP